GGTGRPMPSEGPVGPPRGSERRPGRPGGCDGWSSTSARAGRGARRAGARPLAGGPDRRGSARPRRTARRRGRSRGPSSRSPARRTPPHATPPAGGAGAASAEPRSPAPDHLLLRDDQPDRNLLDELQREADPHPGDLVSKERKEPVVEPAPVPHPVAVAVERQTGND